jgi:hypothetical protein
LARKNAAAKLSPAGRTANARNPQLAPIGTSDKVLATLLQRLKATADPKEIRELSDQIEQVIFHKQFENA